MEGSRSGLLQSIKLGFAWRDWRWSMPQPRLEAGTSHKQVRSFIAWATLLGGISCRAHHLQYMLDLFISVNNYSLTAIVWSLVTAVSAVRLEPALDNKTRICHARFQLSVFRVNYWVIPPVSRPTSPKVERNTHRAWWSHGPSSLTQDRKIF